MYCFKISNKIYEYLLNFRQVYTTFEKFDQIFNIFITLNEDSEFYLI